MLSHANSEGNEGSTNESHFRKRRSTNSCRFPQEKNAEIDVSSIEQRDSVWIIRGTCPIDLKGHPWAEKFEVVIDQKGKIKSTDFFTALERSSINFQASACHLGWCKSYPLLQLFFHHALPQSPLLCAFCLSQKAN